MGNVDTEIRWYMQAALEAKAARDEDGIVCERGDVLAAAAAAGDRTPFYRLAGVSSAPVVALEPLRVQGTGTGTGARTAAPAKERRANKYAANCVLCSTRVAAEAGYLTKDAKGAWAAEHKAGECVAASTTQAVRKAAAVEVERAAKAEITEGFWTVGEAVYKVQQNQAGTNLYGKRLTEDGWEYVAGIVGLLTRSGAERLTEERAAAYGHLYGCCLICGRRLNDEESIARGIGPVCAAKQGW